MDLYFVFDWLELTAVGVAIRDSAWLFPVIESVHLLGLATLGGAVLIVDLRLLGALLVMFMTRIPLFLFEAIKCYFRPAFWVKMGTLLVALLFTFGLRNRVVRNRPNLSPWQARSIAGCSLVLWFTVAAAGRWIGFS